MVLATAGLPPGAIPSRRQPRPTPLFGAGRAGCERNTIALSGAAHRAEAPDPLRYCSDPFGAAGLSASRPSKAAFGTAAV